MEKIILKMKSDYHKEVRCIFWDGESGATTEANKEFFALNYNGLELIALPSGIHYKHVERKTLH